MTINLPKMTVKCENKKCKKVFERYTYNGEALQKYWCPECVKKAKEEYEQATRLAIRGY